MFDINFCMYWVQCMISLHKSWLFKCYTWSNAINYLKNSQCFQDDIISSVTPGLHNLQSHSWLYCYSYSLWLQAADISVAIVNSRLQSITMIIAAWTVTGLIKLSMLFFSCGYDNCYLVNCSCFRVKYSVKISKLTMSHLLISCALHLRTI